MQTIFFLNANTNCNPFKSVKTEIYDSLFKKKGIKASQEGGRKCSFCRNSC